MSATFDARTLRDAFGAFLTGVTVVTSIDTQGHPIGLTANSFSSVSLEPPLLSVCIAKSTGSYTCLCQASYFAINILAEDQKAISNTFARPAQDRFSRIDWHPGETGSPVLENTAAWFECMVHQRIDAGDHMILLGEVKAFANNGKTGLGYARGAYFTPSQTESRLLENSAQTLHLAAERDGELLLVPDAGAGWTLPALDKAPNEGIEHLQSRFTHQFGLPLQMGLLYSIYEDTHHGRRHIVYRASLGTGEIMHGQLFGIQQLPLADIHDHAIRETLRRYSQESQLGHFGLYIGDQVKGHVHTLHLPSNNKAAAQ